MTFRPRRLVTGLAMVLVAGCSQGSGGGHATAKPSATAATPAPAPSAIPTPTPTASPGPPQPLSFKVEVLAGGLAAPWEVAFLPDGAMLITERQGRVRVFRQGKLLPDPALTINVVSAPGAEGGLLGMTLHPGFPSPSDVYLYYTYRGSGGNTNRLSRFTYGGDRLTDERVVLDGIPAGVSYHDGGRIRFGPDGMLYVTTGEGYIAGRAADRGSLGGKILRLRDDGSVPADNPTPGSLVYAFGLRNPQGLAWDRAGHLYASDNGPTGEFGLCCHDELNLIQPGGFYGWPLLAGRTQAGRAQDYPAVPDATAPIAESGNDTWAPSGIAIYTPAASEQATLLMATLRGQALRRFIIDPAQPGNVLSEEVVLTGYGRLREVVQGGDGCAYVLTSNRDGRGSPVSDDDRLLRLCKPA